MLSRHSPFQVQYMCSWQYFSQTFGAFCSSYSSFLTLQFLTLETWKARGYISHLYKTSSKTIIFSLSPYYVMFGKWQRVKRHAVAYPQVWDKRCILQTWRVGVNILSKHIMESWEGLAINFRVWMQVCKVTSRIFQGSGREAYRTD